MYQTPKEQMQTLAPLNTQYIRIAVCSDDEIVRSFRKPVGDQLSSNWTWEERCNHSMNHVKASKYDESTALALYLL